MKQNSFQLWCSSVSIGLAVMVLQLATCWQFIAFITIVLGVFSKSSDSRKYPIYSIGFVAGFIAATMIQWGLTSNKANLNHFGNGLSGYVATVTGALLLCFALGHLIKVARRRKNGQTVTGLVTKSI